MPTISGSLLLNLSLTETTATPGVVSSNAISLSEILSPTPVKIAFLSGTVGTSALAVNASTYKDSTGSAVSFTRIDRVFLSSSGTNAVSISPTNANDPAGLYLTSKSGEIAVSSTTDTASSSITLKTTAGTNDYTAVLYGA